MNTLNCFSQRMNNPFRKRRKPQKYYFIASVRDIMEELEPELKKLRGLPDDWKYENHEHRCWGFYLSKDRAIRAVTENWTDMNEAGYYKYAVIEPHYEGLINPIINEDIWFVAKYDKEKKICLGYERCERPKWAEHVCGWTIS